MQFVNIIALSLYDVPYLLCALQHLTYSGSDGYKYENTYKLGTPERLFDSPGVVMMLSELLTETLSGHRYEPQQSARTALDIVTIARNRLKALALPRYTVHLYIIHRTQNTDRQTDRQTDWYLLFYAVSQCYKLNLMPKQYRIVNSNIIIVVRPFSVCVSPNIARSNFVPSVWIVYGQRLITTSIRTVGLHQRRYCQRSLLGSRLQPR